MEASKKEKALKDIGIGMGLMDTIPVLLFAITMQSLIVIFSKTLFVVGAVLIVLAGLLKALWKIVLDVSKKNIPFLNKQMRIIMPVGFLLVIVSLFVYKNAISFEKIKEMIQVRPGIYLFALAGVGFVAMGVLGAMLDSSKKRSNWIEQSVNTVAQFALCIAVLSCRLAVTSYHATEEGYQALAGTETVIVSEIEEGYFFDGAGEDCALVFYPGALVDVEAYAPLALSLAEEGADVFLIKMPYNLALYNTSAGTKIKQKYNYAHWYLCGHSLGGAMAANHIAKSGKGFDGLILLAAYPTKLLPKDNFRVLSVYGENDGVLHLEKYEKQKEKIPGGFQELLIPGGNHAGFGVYGPQNGDGEATIPASMQQEITAIAILNFIK